MDLPATDALNALRVLVGRCIAGPHRAGERLDHRERQIVTNWYTMRRQKD